MNAYGLSTYSLKIMSISCILFALISRHFVNDGCVVKT